MARPPPIPTNRFPTSSAQVAVSEKRIPVRTHAESDSEASTPVDDVDVTADGVVVDENESVADRQPEAAASGPPEDELAQARAELDAAQDRALRFQAELENYRRRAAREMEQQQRYAALPLLRDLLPVWDNVRRAIEVAEQAGGDPAVLQGFAMVAGQLEDVLRRHDCQKIDALYHPFDPNLHEAITQQPSGEHPAGTIIGETQTGFRLHDRVVRASQVIVSIAAPSGEDGEDDGEES